MSAIEPDVPGASSATAVRQLSAVDSSDIAVVGGKGANLGELIRAGFPVPPGFAVTAGAYRQVLKGAGIREQVRDAGAGVDAHDPEAVSATAAELQDAVRRAPLPEEVRIAVLQAYAELGDNVSVAVRSSATGEDTSDFSFAGLNESYTNVSGGEELLVRIRDCWASLFGPRVLAYRARRGITAEPIMAVIVQRMVESARSGIAFSADPMSGDRSRVLIDAAFGLGEVVVGGELEPDRYVVAKSPLQLVEARVGRKSHKVVRGSDGRDVRVDLTAEEAGARVLTSVEALQLAQLVMAVESHYGAPQDVEWAADDEGAFWLLQARPITTLPSAGSGNGNARPPRRRRWRPVFGSASER